VWATTLAASFVAVLAVMGMITTVNGNQGRSNDGVWAIWTHAPSSVGAWQIISPQFATTEK
jgi:hypothetical protein